MDHEYIDTQRTSTPAVSGPSMLPTLRVGDGLIVQAYDQQTTVRAGDVVVFCSAAKHRSVVHRVMSVSAAGIRTRGDNNNGMDPDLLQPADISGKVTAVRRGRRITPIWNGAAGRLRGRLCHTRRQLALRVSAVFRPLYRRLADSGILRLPSRWLGVRVVRLQRKRHIVLYALLWGRWAIGRYAPGDQEWHIRRPFRLFLDVDTLPTA
jgi:signal peptidase I